MHALDNIGVIFILSAEELPTFRDCLQVYQDGYRSPGTYLIDFSNSGSPLHVPFLTKSYPVYCKNGWTHILKRGGVAPSDQVRTYV